MEIITKNVIETENAGEAFARRLSPYTVVAMYGELGAGKTAFVRGMARGLDTQISVVSPTFTVVNEYGGKPELFHFDMYRLASADELFDIGWDDYLARGGICAVEWSENVSAVFDGTEISVKIETLSDNERKITITQGQEGKK